MRFKLQLIVKENEMVLAGYGVAYLDYFRRQAVCYPIILHWIVRLARLAWFWFKYPPELEYERTIARAYYDGFADGVFYMQSEAEARKETDREH